MLTGMFANALGWDWIDRMKLQGLQNRLVYGALSLQDHEIMTDTQNVNMQKNDAGWTTRGKPEGRAGASSSYNAPHRRRRDYLADANLLVAVTLTDDSSPSLDDIAEALECPARPLFIGRKPCLPAGYILEDRRKGISVHSVLLSLATDKGVSYAAAWPEDAGPRGDRISEFHDLRVWKSGLHGGSRRLVEGQIGGMDG